MDILIINSGCANINSVKFALERLGARVTVSSDPKLIAQAPKVILPGVGAAQQVMNNLKNAGLDEILPTLTQPVLGICLGMQILFSHSQEDQTKCLGIIDSQVTLLNTHNMPIPHMGWNDLQIKREDPLVTDLQNPDLYFVHSYAAPVGPWTIATAHYGDTFSAIIRQKNFWGCQFHPERSGADGAKILKNFLEAA